MRITGVFAIESRQHAFGHIFAGGYSVGYYSYKSAEVLDAEAFEPSKENGIFYKEVAQSFRDNILSRGNVKPPMDIPMLHCAVIG